MQPGPLPDDLAGEGLPDSPQSRVSVELQAGGMLPVASPETIPFDPEPVRRVIAGHLPDADGPLRVEPLGGGTSNPTYLLELGPHELVLRHPPIAHGLQGAHDVHREYRAIAALHPTDVPVARPICYCDDPTVLGVPFYVMERVHGMILADKPPVQPIPAGYADTEEERRRIGFGLVETLIHLHAIDYEAVGLGDFGRPAGYVARQVRRWTDEWNRWKTRESPVMDEVLRRLAASIPEAETPTIVHGDYRVGNTILDADDPGRIRAVLDWEMATLGHPIADLGYTLIYWNEEGDDPVRWASMDLGHIAAQPGFLSRQELVEEYARQSGRDVSLVDYFEMLGRMKLAVFGERGYARALAAVGGDEAALAGHLRSGGRESCDRHAAVALAVANASSNRELRAR
jgi:aminoglycoside phosphotransferase (APT) family kinase protein